MRVRVKSLVVTAVLALTSSSVLAGEGGKHLFVLSGQSNMQGHRPEEAFTPAVEKEFGKEHVIVVQDALGGQPIQRWYKDWKSPDGEAPKSTGDLYDRLMEKVKAEIEGQQLQSVTLIWMQGERDARMEWGDVYAASLQGLYAQFCKDIGRSDVCFVIGRLSDFGMDNTKYPHWTKIREAQTTVAESNPRFAWVNTDDLNDGMNRRGKKIKDDLHYSADGYKTLGKRFADSATKLIRQHSSSQ